MTFSDVKVWYDTTEKRYVVEVFYNDSTKAIASYWKPDGPVPLEEYLVGLIKGAFLLTSMDEMENEIAAVEKVRG